MLWVPTLASLNCDTDTIKWEHESEFAKPLKFDVIKVKNEILQTIVGDFGHNFVFQASNRSPLVEKAGSDTLQLRPYICDVASYHKLRLQLKELFAFKSKIVREAKNFVDSIRTAQARYVSLFSLHQVCGFNFLSFAEE